MNYSKNENVIFYCNDVNLPTIAFMGRIKKIPILGDILKIESELIQEEISNKVIIELYKKIILLPYLGLEINYINQYSSEYEIGLCRSGFLRPINFFSCPLSKIIDLFKPIKYDRN